LCFRAHCGAVWIFLVLLVAVPSGVAQIMPLISSDFATNTVSGTAARSIEWTTAAGVTMGNSGNLTSLNGYNFGVLGGNSTGGTITVNNNLNTANQTATQRGFSVDFSVSGNFTLGRLTVRAGHVNSSGAKQVYVSTLNYRIVKIADSSVAASGNRSFDYAGTDVFFDRVFTLSGELEAGAAYRLEVGMNNLVSGGAYAIYDGVTLEVYPEPGSNPRFAQRLNFAKYQKDAASAENGGYRADFAVDGIVSNFHSWRTGAVTGAQTLEITYPRAVTLGSAHLYSGIVASTTSQVWQNFRIQYHDGIGWVDVPGSVTGTNTSPELNILFSSPVTSSRFRLLSSNTGSTSRTVRELAMFPPNPNGSGVEQGYPIGTDVTINLAAKRPAVASTIDGTNYAIRAVDGFVDDSSRWLCTAGAPGQTLEIDLLADHAIGSAHLYSGDLATQTNALGNFTLESWDGTAWQPIPGAAITGNTNTALAVTFGSTVVTSRVRLVTNDGSAARVAELLLFPPRTGGYPLGTNVRVEPPPSAAWNDFSDASHRIRIQPTPDRRLGLIGGSAVFTDNSAGAAAINWQLLLNHSDGSYRIRHLDTGLCLGLAEITRNPGGLVVGETYSGMPHQSWFLEYVSPTKFRLINAYSGLALQPLNGNTALGTPLAAATPGASKLQQWDTARQTHHPKKGLAATTGIPDPTFTDPTATWMSHIQSQFKSVSWSYSWGRQTSDTFPMIGNDQTFNPMQWGNFNFDQGTSTPPLEFMRNDLQSNPKPANLMGFNEPDKSNQSNVSVATAIARWPRLMAMDAPLVSPVPATNGPEAVWLPDFMNQAQALGYRTDHVAVHWYAEPYVDSLIAVLQDVYDKWQRPVWLTEFSTVRWSGTITWSDADNFNFLAEFLWRAESLPWLARYSLFNFRESDGTVNQTAPDPADAPRGNSLRSDGTLTAFGALYAGWDGVASVVSDKSYHLHNKGTYRRARNPASADSVTSVTPDNPVAGDQWVLIPGTTANTVRIVSARDGRRLRVTTTTNVRLEAATNTGTETEWRLTAADQAGWFYISHPATNQRLQINPSGTILMGSISGATSGYWWRFVVPVNPETSTVPAAPVIASATPAADSIAVAWLPVVGAVSYTLQVLNADWENLAVGITGTSWTETGLASATTRSYRVIAVNALGSSTPSATASATTLPAPNPLETFAAWQAAFLSGVPAAQRLPEADPDADTLTNLEEYAFASDPLKAGPSPFRAIPAVSGDIVIEFSWNWRGTNISWKIRGTTDLAAQTPWPVVVPARTDTVRQGDTDLISLTFPLNNLPKQFFVLEISAQP
jgi:hypothetical protein